MERKEKKMLNKKIEKERKKVEYIRKIGEKRKNEKRKEDKE